MTGDALLYCFKEKMHHDLREGDRLFVEAATEFVADLTYLGRTHELSPEQATSLNKMINEVAKHRDAILEQEERRNMKGERRESCTTR